MLHFPGQLGVQKTRQSSLESCVIVDRHFVLKFILTRIGIGVLGIRATNKGSIDDLTIRIRGGVIGVIACRRKIRAGPMLMDPS